MKTANRLVILFVAVTLLAGTAFAEDSPAVAALKGRTAAPTAASFDHSVTLAALLTKTAPTDWSAEKAAVVEGYVVQAVKSDDGDYRLTLAAKPGETNTKRWLIVEATPAWMAKEPSLAEAKLADRSLVGKRVKVMGWLFYDATEVAFPRGSNWEIHPLTSLEILAK